MKNVNRGIELTSCGIPNGRSTSTRIFLALGGIQETANAGDLDAGRGTEAEGIDRAGPLAAIAAALVALSPAERQRSYWLRHL
jgi:hypothetical protein